MKIVTETVFWDGENTYDEDHESLVWNAYAAKEENDLIISISVEDGADLTTIASSTDGVYKKEFTFELEQEEGVLRTTVSFEPESEEELKLIDQDDFYILQISNQWIFSTSPWKNIADAKFEFLGSFGE